MTTPCRTLAALALVAGVLVALPAREAHAQQPTQSEMAVARDLFRSGLEAARAGQWEEALRNFERSYRVAAVPTTLLNLAGAQVETGHLVAGMESYQRFLPQATRGRAASYREQAQHALAAVRRRVPHVTITSNNVRPRDELHIDGETISMGVLGTELPLDPGTHTIALVRGTVTLASEQLTLSEGESRALELEPRAAPSLDVTLAGGDHTRHADVLEADTQDTHEDDGSGGGVLASPWFWTGVVVVVAGAVVAAVLLANSGGADLYSGNVVPGHVTF